MSARKQHEQKLLRILISFHERYPAAGLDALVAMIRKESPCMSRNGEPYDNAVAENFFSCLKCELVHHKHYRTRSEAQADIFAYIEAYYNSVRPQSALNWLSPVEYEHLLSVYAAKVA